MSAARQEWPEREQYLKELKEEFLKYINKGDQKQLALIQSFLEKVKDDKKIVEGFVEVAKQVRPRMPVPSGYAAKHAAVLAAANALGVLPIEINIEIFLLSAGIEYWIFTLCKEYIRATEILQEGLIKLELFSADEKKTPQALPEELLKNYLSTGDEKLFDRALKIIISGTGTENAEQNLTNISNTLREAKTCNLSAPASYRNTKINTAIGVGVGIGVAASSFIAGPAATLTSAASFFKNIAPIAKGLAVGAGTGIACDVVDTDLNYNFRKSRVYKLKDYAEQLIQNRKQHEQADQPQAHSASSHLRHRGARRSH